MTRAIPLVTAFLSGGLIAGVTVAVLTQHPPEPDDSGAPTPDTEKTARDTAAASDSSRQLQRTLTQQQQIIAALEQEVAWLNAIVADLKQGAAEVRRSVDTPRQKWFDEAALQEADIPAADIATLKQEVEALELDKLTLRNRAQREGWGRTSKLRRQLRAMDEAFAERLAPTEYDRYLYATGHHNRVEVTDVLAQSPAGSAGIRPGDHILSYAGKPVFDRTALYRRTTKGTPGEMVPVRLQRDGEVITVYIPRGSMGIRFRSTRAMPRQ